MMKSIPKFSAFTGCWLQCLLLASLAVGAGFGQTATGTGTAAAGSASTFVPAETTALPHFVRFNGAAKNLSGTPLTGVVGITFALYAERSGGAPLWLETQNVQADSNGHYSVLLGATKPQGLPAELFASELARWVGVQVSGQAEQPRVLLVSAPYALKAGDAETLGGLPPSAFMLAAPAAGAYSAAPTASAQNAPPVANNITGTGTVNFVPLWDSSSDIVSSTIFQSGTGTTSKIGINTTTPTSTLDVKGGGTIRGTLSLPVTGNATATAGKNSQPLSLAASAFNSTSATAVNQNFQWLAEPAANNTASPAGTLNLRFGEGSAAPSETGLSIASNGQITFAVGQTFPITGTGGGTITGVTAGSDLTGGGTSGTVTLSLNTSSTDGRYARLKENNTFSGAQTINGTETITVNNPAEALNVSQTLTGLTGDAIHGITSATGGTGVFGEGAIGIQGLAIPSTGLAALFRGTVKTNGNGNNIMIGDPGCGSGYGGIGFVSGNLSGCTNYALLGETTGDTFVNSSGTGHIHFRSNNNELVTIDNDGNVVVKGQNGGGNLTVAGNLTVTGQPSGDGVKGESPNVGVYGSSGGASKTGSGRGKSGVWGDSGGAAGSGYEGVLGTADENSAGVFVNNGTYTSLIAHNLGSGTGVEGIANGSGYGVEGSSGNLGVVGVSNGFSQEGSNYGFAAGVWGDSGGGVGVLGTAGDNEAGAFYSKTEDYFTMVVENDALVNEQGNPTIIFTAQGGPESNGIFCFIDTTASVNCVDGDDEVTVNSGARKVALYSMQSTENWFEDAGAGQLSHGLARVELDPTYAQTVNTGVDYRVFLTPNGDCKGLYVSQKTATSFEVHELGGGRSNIAFDYRIMAKRRGRENVRLKDLTERMNKVAEMRRKQELMRQSAMQRLPKTESPIAAQVR
jgi:hypothetical protein